MITFLSVASYLIIYLQQRFSYAYLFWFYVHFFKTVSTKEFIIGTDNGQLHGLAVDEKDKKEKYIKFLFELTELPEAFMGLQVFLGSAYSLFLFNLLERFYDLISF